MIASSTAESLRNILDAATAGKNPSLPGVVYCAVDSKGEEFFKHVSGRRGLNHEDAMTFDTVFWLASFTKLLTGIACMQLVEQGMISLDNPDEVERAAPELAAVQVLDRDDGGHFHLRPQDRRITLRMLLNHTGEHWTQCQTVAPMLTADTSSGVWICF